MNGLIKVDLYGGNRVIATLTKEEKMPDGVFSSLPVKARVKLTSILSTTIELVIDQVSIHDNTTILVSSNNLQIWQLLEHIDTESFKAFTKEAEQAGWLVEKYIDSISHYYGSSTANQPPSGTFSSNLIQLLFLVAAASIASFLPMPPNDHSLLGLYLDFLLFVCAIAITFGLFVSAMNRLI
jgi:hypothetical protein